MGNGQAQSAEVTAEGVRYRIWAPEHAGIAVHLFDPAGARLKTVRLIRQHDGFHEGTDASGAAGDLYKYEIDGRGVFPDPLSRCQPQGVHGPSMLVDPSRYVWHDAAWRRPPFRELAIYELHVGTFTPEGTFAAAIARLPYLRALGITAVELMPVADFPGERNWGYDGVSLYAPSHAYGPPDDFRALVDAAHDAGLTVILDVVYNHFGPDGNYLREFSAHYFNAERKTPWGDSLNFDRPDGKPVRAFFLENALYWMRDFHIDGFRMDATHAIFDDSPTHLVAEIAAAVQARGGFVIAEDERNEARIVVGRDCGGYGCDAVWADDFHHNVQVALTGDAVYREDYKGDVDELVETLAHGWFYRGQFNRHFQKEWGTECRDVSLEKFVFCISNHDQVGNRAFGERLSHLVSPAQYRAASALLCLTAYTPLIFMGQEWAASTPFLYFTDHHDDLGKLVTEGRRKDFDRFEEFRDPKIAAQIPDPQALETFQKSKLDWAEVEQEDHAPVLNLYRALLKLRREHGAFRPRTRDDLAVEKLAAGVAALRMRDKKEEWLLLVDLIGKHRGDLHAENFCAVGGGEKWQLVLSSNAREFGGSSRTSYDEQNSWFAFDEAELLVLRRPI